MTIDNPLDLNRINPEDFTIYSLDDEIRVDELCRRLLLGVRDQIFARGALTPREVGELCHGADYFLREFIIAECADNLFRLPLERVRQFAGHWYVVRTLEPNARELAGILAGVAECYQILARHRLVSPELAGSIATACTDLPFYSQRIDDFRAIESDGFDRWRTGCPLSGGHS